VLGSVAAAVGILTVTLAEMQHQRLASCPSCAGTSPFLSIFEGSGESGRKATENMRQWMVGVGLISLALLLSSTLGHYQQSMYRTYAPNWREGLLWQHALSLPYFIFLYSNIAQHWSFLSFSPQLFLGDYLPSALLHAVPTWFAALRAPRLLLVLAGNLCTQIVCIIGVQQLTTVTDAVTITFALTVRKLLSLLLSVWWFAHPFSGYHWFGTACVFGGAIAFAVPAAAAAGATLKQREAAVRPAPSSRQDEGRVGSREPPRPSARLRQRRS
jgi:hypothetical protein